MSIILGQPQSKAFATVRKLLDEGRVVKILNDVSVNQSQIDAWTLKHFGVPFPVVVKDTTNMSVVVDKRGREWEPYIAVDLDGTLAKPLESYDGLRIGDPIKGPFFDKVKQAVADGLPIRILTARVAYDKDGKIADAIKAWTLKYLGKELPVTNEKDPGMTEIWDDRAHTPDEIDKCGPGKSSGFGTIIECVSEGNLMWAHVTCDDGNRVALQFDYNVIVDNARSPQVGDHVQWNEDNLTLDDGEEFPLINISKATGSKEGTWVTINGQHILVGSDGKPLAGNPKVLGQRSVSRKVDIARKNAVLTGKHEQDIADRGEKKLAAALGIPRTKNNSAYDIRDDSIGIEVKTMVTGKNDKVTMSATAIGRKLAEQRANGLKVYTVVADMRGRLTAKYYVREGVGSFRLASMRPVTLLQLRSMVKDS